MNLNLEIKNTAVKWVLLCALLAVTLWFPSTRETQTLCLRWLFHSNGDTFVQGAQSGENMMFLLDLIPNVQFDPEHVQDLRRFSTNSLDDFALACAADPFQTANSPKLNFPRTESGWKTNSLLPWFAFKLTTMTALSCGTNALSPARLYSLLPVLRLAETADPSNGALWQAEATLEFRAHENEAAIQSLRTSTSRREWTAYSGKAYGQFVQLLEQAGLPELDAAIKADELNSPAIYAQEQSVFSLEDLLTQAAGAGKLPEFTNLFQLFVELRRPDWVGSPPIHANFYRWVGPNDELIGAMAGCMKVDLPTNWTDFNYINAGTNAHTLFEKRETIRGQVFQNFLNRYEDPAVAATFNAQTEAFQTEKFLREKLQYSYWDGPVWLKSDIQIAGVSSLFFLTALSLILTGGAFNWYLGKRPAFAGKWPIEFKFWIFGFISMFVCAWLIATLAQAHGIDVHTDSDLPDPPPLVNLDLSVWMLSLGVSCALIGGLLHEWKKGKVETGFPKTVCFLGFSYLACTIVLSFFRSQLFDVITSYHH